MFNPFAVYTITVLRPTTKIVYGSEVVDWDNPVEHQITNCGIQGGDSTEDHNRADGVTIQFTVFAPLDADIDENDRVRFTYGGREYTNLEVDGMPSPMVDVFNVVSHQVVKLKKREG